MNSRTVGRNRRFRASSSLPFSSSAPQEYYSWKKQQQQQQQNEQKQIVAASPPKNSLYPTGPSFLGDDDREIVAKRSHRSSNKCPINTKKHLPASLKTRTKPVAQNCASSRASTISSSMRFLKQNESVVRRASFPVDTNGLLMKKSQSKKKREKKRLRFASNLTRVLEVTSLREMSPMEKRMVWFSRDEILAIRNECMDTACGRKGRNVDLRGLENRTLEGSKRRNANRLAGLYAVLHEQSKQQEKQRRRQRQLVPVPEEDEEEEEGEEEDECENENEEGEEPHMSAAPTRRHRRDDRQERETIEAIAKVYRPCSQWCQRAAHAIAFRDRVIVLKDQKRSGIYTPSRRRSSTTTTSTDLLDHSGFSTESTIPESSPDSTQPESETNDDEKEHRYHLHHHHRPLHYHHNREHEQEQGNDEYIDRETTLNDDTVNTDKVMNLDGSSKSMGSADVSMLQDEPTLSVYVDMLQDGYYSSSDRKQPASPPPPVAVASAQDNRGTNENETNKDVVVVEYSSVNYLLQLKKNRAKSRLRRLNSHRAAVQEIQRSTDARLGNDFSQ